MGRGWGGGGGVLFALPAFLVSVISSFLPKIKGGGGGVTYAIPFTRTYQISSHWLTTKFLLKSLQQVKSP